MHELRPIEEPFSSEIRSIFDHYPKGKDGYILRLFRLFANSMRFLTNKGVVNLLDKESPVSMREREIVILRVTANKDCEYEWGVHASVFPKAAGLSEEQVIATRLGASDAECWNSEDSLLIRCVDELCLHAAIQEDTYPLFQNQWNLEQQLEIRPTVRIHAATDQRCVVPGPAGHRVSLAVRARVRNVQQVGIDRTRKPPHP